MPGLAPPAFAAAQVAYTRQTYNGLMAAYAEAGATHKCRELHARMAAQDITPDEVAYSCILRSYACAPPPGRLGPGPHAPTRTACRCTPPRCAR